MKRFVLLQIFLLTFSIAFAQEARVFRTEFLTYDQREDALSDLRDKTKGYEEFRPQMIDQNANEIVWMQTVEVDAARNDYNTFLHLENVGAAYALEINSQQVIHDEDCLTPSDLNISSYLRQGHNQIILRMQRCSLPQLQEGIEIPKSELFANSYLFIQRRIAIRDFDIRFAPDSTRSFGVLNMDIVIANDFNYEEPIAIGYDIYDPKGELKDFSVKEITVAGRSLDTLHLKPYIYHTNKFKWEGGQAPLYTLTFYIKRSGMLWEYIPLKIGFGQSEWRDGKLYRFDNVVELKRVSFNAAADEATTRENIAQLRKSGYNTLCPEFPQPKWFYDLCDREGMYVIDCAAINAQSSDDRSRGGTPANDPQLCEEFLLRVKKMYYRSRNHTCIVGFSLGGQATGNGYNMYKAYEWLKSVEQRRPVFYFGNAGEWNSDKQ